MDSAFFGLTVEFADDGADEILDDIPESLDSAFNLVVDDDATDGCLDEATEDGGFSERVKVAMIPLRLIVLLRESSILRQRNIS